MFSFKACFKDFLAIDDGGYYIGLCNLLDIVVEEVAVKHCHVGDLAELDGSQAVLLMPLTGHIDSHGAQRLFAGDGLLRITRFA